MSGVLKVTVVPQPLGGQEVTAVPAAHLPSAQLLFCAVVAPRAGAGAVLLGENTAGSRIAHMGKAGVSFLAGVIINPDDTWVFVFCVPVLYDCGQYSLVVN